jgi:hypothetical protein
MCPVMSPDLPDLRDCGPVAGLLLTASTRFRVSYPNSPTLSTLIESLPHHGPMRSGFAQSLKSRNRKVLHDRP